MYASKHVLQPTLGGQRGKNRGEAREDAKAKKDYGKKTHLALSNRLPPPTTIDKVPLKSSDLCFSRAFLWVFDSLRLRGPIRTRGRVRVLFFALLRASLLLLWDALLRFVLLSLRLLRAT